MTTPAPPMELRDAGKRLWLSALADYELDEHELALLLQACRTADYLDRLAADAANAPLLIKNSRGDDVANPLLTESRQQSIVLARLLAALRMPSGEEESRPQRRGGARGTYRIRPVS